MNTFADFNLLPSLQTTLTEKQFLTPTEIQRRALPALLLGHSYVGVSETGSGKTLAYALPVLHLLKTLENKGTPVTVESQPRAVVIVPMRELGEQVSKVFKPFTHTTRLRVRTVLGGTTMQVARTNTSGLFDVLVATPGRLVKMLEQKQINLSDVRTLIFDEADQMLDPTFLKDATKIVEACPPRRQMALFSATVSPTVQELIKKLFAGAQVFRSEGSHRVVKSLTTQNLKVLNGKRYPVLEKILAKPIKGGTLIFTNTRAQCDTLAQELQKKGRKCAIYRGEMDKVVRRTNLKAFRDGKLDVLIATDLASRGLDIANVGCVINYHMPQHMENYLHRVGRTARAGRAGLVINLITERDHVILKQLDSVKAKLAQGPNLKK